MQGLKSIIAWNLGKSKFPEGNSVTSGQLSGQALNSCKRNMKMRSERELLPTSDSRDHPELVYHLTQTEPPLSCWHLFLALYLPVLFQLPFHSPLIKSASAHCVHQNMKQWAIKHCHYRDGTLRCCWAQCERLLCSHNQVLLGFLHGLKCGSVSQSEGP